MPEGPEVYIKAEKLRPLLLGKKLVKVIDNNDKSEHYLNSVIEKIETKGKKLWLALEDGNNIVFSFALEGDIIPRQDALRINRRIMTDLLFEEGEVDYALVDHMGIAHSVVTKDLETAIPNGVDPLHELFGMREWLELCKNNCMKSISRVIVNQNFVAGIGNIYRSEILYHAGIDPTVKIKDIETSKLEKLLVSIYRVLSSAAKEKYTIQVHGKKLDPDGNTVYKVKIAKGLYVSSIISSHSKVLDGSDRTEVKDKKKKSSSSVYLSDDESLSS